MFRASAVPAFEQPRAVLGKPLEIARLLALYSIVDVWKSLDHIGLIVYNIENIEMSWISVLTSHLEDICIVFYLQPWRYSRYALEDGSGCRFQDVGGDFIGP